VFSLLPSCFCLVFLSFFVGRLVRLLLFSVAVHPVVLPAFQFSSAAAQSGSSLVIRWVFLKTRSTLLRKTRAYTRRPIVITGLPASQFRRPMIHQQRTRRSVTSTRLSGDLTRRRVFTTPRAFDHSTVTTGRQAPPRLHAIHLLRCRSVRSVAGFFGRRLSFAFVFVVTLLPCCGCKVVALLLLCIPLVCCIFCVFIFILLSVLFYLPAMTWSDLEMEIVLWVLASIWFFAVPALQLSFNGDGCFNRIELFTEFLCNLHRLVRPWNRSGLLIVLFGLLVITIASCSVLLNRIQYLSLYLHCFLSFGLCCWGALPFYFGFIVGELTPFSFIGSLISSSFRIRSG